MSLKLWGKYATSGLMVIVAVFLCDQASKWAILHHLLMSEGQAIEVTSFFNLTLVWNRGISYGLMASNSQIILIILTLIICVMLWRWLCRAPTRTTAVALGLIIGGALGNALDRYLYGAVVDFLSFFYHNWHWYVFNIADVAIVVGVVILLYEQLIEQRPSGLGNA